MESPRGRNRMRLHPKMQVMTVLWIALLGSNFIYAFVAYAKLQTMSPDGTVDLTTISFANPMTPVLCGAAFLSLVLSRVFPAILTQNATRSRSQLKGEPLTEDQRYQLAMVPFVVRLALIESVGLYGFVIAFLGGGAMGFLLIGVAVAILISARPTPEKIQQEWAL